MSGKHLTNLDTSIPLILLGGMENTLCVVRSLGKLGVKIYVVAPSNCAAHVSRYVSKSMIIPDDLTEEAIYQQLFIDQSRKPLRGAVMLPCSDRAIHFLAIFRERLKQNYILDCASAKQQLALLDKQETIILAKEVGCDAPSFWNVSCFEDVKTVEPGITYPVLIKPIHSHKFQKTFRVKMFLVQNRDELYEKAQKAFSKGLEFMICEHIPGPDSLLSSCYIYIDKDGKEYLKFTKRIVRRSPKNFGRATLHATHWLPETAEVGMRFFRGIKFRGLGNVEFKRDPRDGQLKIIECNARFTAAQEHVLKSGMDYAQLIYRRLTGQEYQNMSSYRQQLYYWYPENDFDAYLELNKLKEITFIQWLGSCLKPVVFPYFSLVDINPFLFIVSRNVVPRINRVIKRLLKTIYAC